MRRGLVRLSLLVALVVALSGVVTGVGADSAYACGTQVRSVGSLGIDWGTTCTVSESSYRYSRLTGGIQRWLNQLGFNCGSADAIFGAQTRQCVNTFQWAVMNRVPQTSSVDAATWRSMESLRALRRCVGSVCYYSSAGGQEDLAARWNELYGVKGAWTIRNRNWQFRVWNSSNQWG
jgi:hypothetical protein